MLYVSSKLFPDRVAGLVVPLVCALILIAVAPAITRAQRAKPNGGDEPEAQPTFSDYKGVRIGMSADESRKKLGNPRDKSAEQDFYIFNDNEAVQIFYEKGGVVSAISIDYMSGARSIPTAKDVLGTDADTKPDGSVYKLMRYPKAGYWVSYSRTAGGSPTTTITMQKIDR